MLIVLSLSKPARTTTHLQAAAIIAVEAFAARNKKFYDHAVAEILKKIQLTAIKRL